MSFHKKCPDTTRQNAFYYFRLRRVRFVFQSRPAEHSLKTFCGVSSFGVLCVCIVNHAEYNISWNSLSFSSFVASGSGDYAREAIGIRGLGL